MGAGAAVNDWKDGTGVVMWTEKIEAGGGIGIGGGGKVGKRQAPNLPEQSTDGPDQSLA